jgi:hypothetical protein
VGRLLTLNLGTYAETHRFKATAFDRGYLDADALDAAAPGELVQPGGAQRRSDFGAQVYSFYGLKPALWRGTLASGGAYKDAFLAWAQAALRQPVHCLYLTGHHWGGEDCYLSWTHYAKDFNARFHAETQQLNLGLSGNYIALDTAGLRAEMQLIVGFGCDVANRSNSAKYRRFFDSRPVVLAWDATITVPRRHQASVNERFFDHLDTYVQAQGGPATNRLDWVYKTDPMALVRAWGHATANWFAGQARARGTDGNYYRFKRDARSGERLPVKA